MTVGETLLKITDYPFAYSLTAILLATHGLDLFAENSLIFLGIAGSVGTVLTITDPLGRLLRWLMIRIEKRMYGFLRNEDKKPKRLFNLITKINPKILDELKIEKKWHEFESAFHTKSIELEKEKIVSSIYFLILILVTNIMILDYNAIENNSENIILEEICEISCVKFYSTSILTGISFILSVVIAWNSSKIFRRVRTVSTYLTTINHPFVMNSSTENLSRFIESGDWKTAEYWRDIVETEFLNEQGLIEVRTEKLKNHLNSILGKFKTHKENIQKQNSKTMADYLSGDHSVKTISLIELLQSFSYYENLVEHFFTNKNMIKYDQILRVLDLNQKWNDSFSSTIKEKKDRINDILTKLCLEPHEKTNQEIKGENGQWINLELLEEHIDHFVASSRTKLIPISLKHDSANWQVRIFDRRGHEDLGPDIVAELYKEDAKKLSSELEQLSLELKQKNLESQNIYSKIKEAEKELAQMIDELIHEYESVIIPIEGSCKYCRTEEFWNKNVIKMDEEKIKNIDKMIYQKSDN